MNKAIKVWIEFLIISFILTFTLTSEKPYYLIGYTLLGILGITLYYYITIKYEVFKI